VTISLRGYTLADLQAIFTKHVAKITTTVAWQYLAADGTWRTLDGGPFTHVLDANATQAQLSDFTQTATQTVKDRTLFGTLGGATTASITFVPPADAALVKVNGVSSRWIRGVLRSQQPYGTDGVLKFNGNTPDPVGPTYIPPVIEKIEISYQYKTSSVPLDRMTTVNNFEVVSQPRPLFANAQTITPFVALAGYAPAGVSAFLAGTPGLYLGFDDPFGTAFISIFLALVDRTAIGQSTPLGDSAHVLWEYLTPALAWKPLDVVDGTSDLTASGIVGFQAPNDSSAVTLFPQATSSRPFYWYRARLVSGSYGAPPRLAAVLTNTVMADNRQTVRTDWVLASGSGDRGQQATILRRPVLAGDIWVRENEVPSDGERQQLVDELTERLIEDGVTTSPSLDDVVFKRFAGTPAQEVWVRWLRVPNFRASGPRSRHYTLEAPTGVVTFGDGEGGLIPPIGKDNIVVRGLSSGGGEQANRVAGPLAIKELKTSLPFVDKIFNFSSAVGGTDSWTIDQTFDLGPQAIKNRGRAVTTEDYEWVTLATFGQVARVKCLPTTKPSGGILAFAPGAVTVIVVPKGTARTPLPPKGLLRRIETFLRSRALGAIDAAADIYALPPEYLPVAIVASIHPRRPEEASVVQRRVVQALEAFFHPLTGGERGDGWPFGRDVYISEVFAVIERTEGVDHVVSAVFANHASITQLPVDDNKLIASGDHQITVV